MSVAWHVWVCPEHRRQVLGQDGGVCYATSPSHVVNQPERVEVIACGSCGMAATWVASERDERNEPVDCCAFCRNRLSRPARDFAELVRVAQEYERALERIAGPRNSDPSTIRRTVAEAALRDNRERLRELSMQRRRFVMPGDMGLSETSLSELDGWRVGDTVTVMNGKAVGTIERIDPEHGLGRWPLLVVFPGGSFCWSASEWLTRIDGDGPPMSVEDRYLYGNVEAAIKVAERLHAAVEHLRACEVEGVAGADDQVVLDALFSYEALRRANA